MATLIKTGTLGTGSPLLAYELYAEQTAASGTSRTVKVTAKFKVNGGSSSYYSYPCNWRARVGSSYGAYQEMKSNTKWSGGDGYRTFSQTIKVDVGTTSSTSITVGLEANHGTYKSWNGSATDSFTVGSTNTAPTMSGYITCRMNSSTGAVITAEGDGIEDAVKIPENVSSIYVSWPAASDKEGGTIKYELYHQRDNGSWVVIYEGTATNYTHKIGAGNQGSKYDYYVKATDNGGLKSNAINATQFMKNNFTGNTISSTETIKYSDGNSTIRLVYSGEKNTATLGNNNGVFTRTLTCNGITVYNNTITKSPIDLTIYKEGDLPNGPYVKLEDLKNKFAGSSYKGTLTFVLTTNNAYGSSATSQMNISTNLQTNPVSSSNIQISRDKNVSTAIKTTRATELDYFLPDGSNVINVSWNAGRDKLGGTVSYDLYYSIGGGTWQLQASGLTALSYNHTIAKLTKQQTLAYMVKTKTSYGTYVDAVAQDAVVLEYYNAPSLSTSNIVRSATGADVTLMIKSNSSILNIETVGTWSCRKKGTTEEVSNGELSITQKSQVITVTNLTEEETYDLVVTFNDNTGFSVNDEKTIAIAANSPIFFVNKYGIGVNGKKANNGISLNSKGNALVDGVLYTDKVSLNNRLGGSTFGLEESSGDVYIANNLETSPNWLRLKQDGTMTWAGKEVYNTSHATSNEVANKLILRDSSGNFKAKSATFSNWVRTTGNTGWLSETHGGGFHMMDSTWIRAYNDKGIYTGGEIKSKTLTSTGNLAVSGTSKLTGTVTTDGAVVVGTQLKLGATNRDVAGSAIWSDNATHNWFDKTTDNQVKFGAAKQTSFDTTTMLRGTCVRIYAHGKVNSSYTSGVFLGSSGSVAVTSDENLKDIYYMDDRYLDFFDNLEPVLYKYKGDCYHRLHAGYGARASERALLDANIPTEDFGGIIKEKDIWLDIDGQGEKHYADIYSLRYEEFIALNSFAIKRNREVIKELQAQVEELTKKIDLLESA